MVQERQVPARSEKRVTSVGDCPLAMSRPLGYLKAILLCEADSFLLWWRATPAGDRAHESASIVRGELHRPDCLGVFLCDSAGRSSRLGTIVRFECNPSRAH